MAAIRNVRLRMGRSTGSLEFAVVTFSVEFSPRELQENLLFGLYTALFERDDSLDAYHPRPNGAFNFGIEQNPKGNPDDSLGWIDARAIRPDGLSTRFFTVRRDLNVGNQEPGNEEYRAYVYVIPEITSGQSWSNEVSVNLG
ncbi:MAG: hypothetical protein AAF489_05465 [Bacteroidota bacterium]